MKQRTRQFFDFIIFSNLFIAACAIIMCLFTVAFFKAGELRLHFIGFIFFSTLASYSIHWYLTNELVEKTASRTTWLHTHKRVHVIFFIISAVGSSIFFLQEISYWKWIWPAIGLTFIYTAPKLPFAFFQSLQKFILGKTFLLAAMWTYITSILPLLITKILLGQTHYLFFINRFALIFAICILFDIRDKQYDRKTGIKSLVTVLPAQKIKNIFLLFILLNFITSIFLNTYYQGVATLIILSVPAIITLLLYRHAIKSRNDYLFYFILDGLMALSPLIFYVVHFFVLHKIS